MENLPLSDTEVLFQNRQKFFEYNRFKLDRIMASFSGPARRVLSILPRLIHVNHDKLPGYVAPNAPSGIHQLKLDQETRRNLEQVFPHAALHRAGSLEPIVHSMILVGSMGTIGQNERSDLDFTLLVDKRRLSPEGLDMLKAKLSRIENWTWNEHGLETHFFVNDVAEVRGNIFGESDRESTGSAQANLLKEEMYRTMTLFAGKAPFWWVVPVETDDERYLALYKQVALGGSALRAGDFIDIGNVDEISPGEFFGGSIWALIKSFHAPFKTLMKMALLEEYIVHPSRFNLLCHDIKRKVHGGVKHEDIDPYLELFDRLQKYFSEKKSNEEIDALRTAFYLKSGTRIGPGELESEGRTPAAASMIRLIHAWNWQPADLERLNHYPEWQMMEKVALGNRLHNILMACYRAISEKQQLLDPGQNWISERDTHLLGRKLFSFYRKAPYKVENILAHVEGKAVEEELTFLHTPARGKETGHWRLIRGHVAEPASEVAEEAVIRQSATLPFLLAFAAWNQLFESGTRIHFRARGASLKEHDLGTVLEDLVDRFRRVDIALLPSEDLLGPERLTQLYLIVDFGLPLARELVQAPPEDADERRAFIAQRLSRIKALSAIRLTSWGELFCKTYTGSDCMGRMLAEIKPIADNAATAKKGFLKIHTPAGDAENPDMPWLAEHAVKVLLAAGRRAQGPKERPAP